jgi:hypothetical protein
MRCVRFCCALLLAAAAAGAGVGCKDKGGKKPPVVDQSLEQRLIARRDALLRNRDDLQAEKDKLAAERQRIVSEGGDTTDVDRRAEDLDTRAAALSSEESQIVGQLLDEREALLAAVQGGNDATARAAFREQAAASREKSVATREEKVAAREAALALREKQLAERERTTCGVGAPTTIIQTVDAKGTKYGKKDVEPVLTKTRSVMSSRGILAADLPPPVRDLEKEATAAMADADYGRAFLAAQQLWKTVSSLPIDRPFIQGKSARISSLVKARKLEPSVQTQVDAWFADATTQFVDGDYKGANKKLNQIWGALN